MSRYTKKDILERVEEEDVEFIRLQFTDLFGSMKNLAITSSHLKHALDNKVMFDGSSIEGFVGIDESDLYLYPDTGTFSMFPWRPQHGKVARLICDVYRPDGTFYEGDPRYILKKVISEAAGRAIPSRWGRSANFSCIIWMTTDCRPILHTNRRGILTWVRWISGKTPAEIWS